ncbi:SDR family NAD(P)-dependent oxidoreductase [Seohaeicola zhoushanensis]|uniref:3-oxoacyl-ACP reductase n=1 Tax=Seohaeicola zhoushanensis TaxID=1569283 RepID=A0A8J3GY12_9RHOB|nr:SDR family NAD(P)-dependent oxidoreductase [Seohaeicola zhoushanensis]GHF49509.1 3-oxoacyl-ACP reductase [Seohaeicola zhoushanensis]
MPTIARPDFAGRVAVVTGGNRGIGLETARLLARGGARLSLWARDTLRLEAAATELADMTEVHIVQADVGDEQAVQAAARAAIDHFGQVDILVNNAGTLGPRAPVGTYLASDFEAVLRINLMGTFHCCSALVPHMSARGYGRIVNVASVAGKDGNPFVSGYAASKAAQIALTKSLGKEVATTGVLVNAVTPSASPTDIFGELDEDRKRALLANVPMARFVAPEEVAQMIGWLCSEACSFSTGATFDISGGRATF